MIFWVNFGWVNFINILNILIYLTYYSVVIRHTVNIVEFFKYLKLMSLNRLKIYLKMSISYLKYFASNMYTKQFSATIILKNWQSFFPQIASLNVEFNLRLTNRLNYCIYLKFLQIKSTILFQRTTRIIWRITSQKILYICFSHAFSSFFFFILWMVSMLSCRCSRLLATEYYNVTSGL